MHILVAKSNANSFTYDGVELGGERITQEIEEKIKDLEQSGTTIRKLSIAGYSLGGLVARYSIGLLYSNGIFDKIQPVNFTTFATPHLGVRAPITGPQSHVWNTLGARTLSMSGQQMFLIDSFRDTNRPLLSVMADPNSIFIRALSLFRNRSLYANIINDRSVPYYTSFVSRTDPYVNLNDVELHYIPNQGANLLLDPENPVTLKSKQQLTLYESVSTTAQSTMTSIPFYALLTVLLPIGATAFLINSGYQTYQSAQRVRLHEAGQAGIGIKRYRIPLLEEAQSLTDRMYERLGNGQSEDYLPTPPPETNPRSPLSDASDEKALARRETNKGQGPFPTLALSKEQFEMIDNIDALRWNKYAVHIQNVRHTHAAIVVRTERESFSEGKIVLQHWADHFEV